MKNKYLTITLFALSIFLIIGISFAYYEITVSGNDNSKDMVVTAGTLELTFNDKDSVITLNNAKPGDYYTKTITVKNTGTLDSSYNLVWQELTNEIINDELVIEATCKQLNASNTEEGTCNPLSETPVKSSKIIKNVSLQPSYTHEYTIKVTFKEMNKSQNYNTNKTFKGKFGIEEYKAPNFSTDSWSTIIANVRAGNGSEYKVGSTKEVNLGSTYGTHTLRVANTSTPSECSTSGFSQSACGFVLEFADIVEFGAMNTPASADGGWPASNMYTVVNTDIYNALPSDLKEGIIDTIVLSEHGRDVESDFTSVDKLYFLSPKEIYTDFTDTYSSVSNLTRTLDYYSNLGVTKLMAKNAMKYFEDSADFWWLRGVIYYYTDNFYVVSERDGTVGGADASSDFGISPAFRIG